MYHLNHMLRIILFRRKNMFRFQDIQVLVISTIFSIWVFFHEHSRINHRTAGEGEEYFFNSSLPLPPTSQTLRH